MKNHFIYKLAAKLRPELNEPDEGGHIQAFAEVAQLFFSLPISIITIIWIFQFTDFSVLQENIFLGQGKLIKT